MIEQESHINSSSCLSEARKKGQDALLSLPLTTENLEKQETKKIEAVYNKGISVLTEFGNLRSRYSQYDFKCHYWKETYKEDLGGLNVQLTTNDLEKGDEFPGIKKNAEFSINIFTKKNVQNIEPSGSPITRIYISSETVSIWREEVKKVPQKVSFSELVQIEKLLESLEIIKKLK